MIRKRYGKARWRKMRDDLARSIAIETSTREAYDMQTGLLQHLQEEEAEHRETLRYLGEILQHECRNSAGLPADTMIMDAEFVRAGVMRFQVIKPMRVLPPSDGDVRAEIVRDAVIDLRKIETYAYRGMQGVHVHMNIGGKGAGGDGVAYFVSDAVLRMGMPPQKRREIVMDIAKQILTAFEERTLAPERRELAGRRLT